MCKRNFGAAAVFFATLALMMGHSSLVMAGIARGGDNSLRSEPVEGEVEFERIAFNAKTFRDGSADGQIQTSVRKDGQVSFVSHIRVECVEFVGDNIAIIGGTVVYDTSPDYIGTAAGMLVRDNGEGQDSPPDERTSVSYTLDTGFNYLDCELIADLIESGELNPDDFVMPIKNGNIQVNP